MHTLGILGGLGPMASVRFYELLTLHTKANCDQEHLDILLSSRATTPDRTAFILGQSEENPLFAMIEEAKKLENAGAEMLVIPCNTAHYFYDSIRVAVSVPMLNIVDETLSLSAKMGRRKLGLLATTGTIETKTYQRRAGKYGIECVVPSEGAQEQVMRLIYDDIKRGGEGDRRLVGDAVREFRAQGCDGVILGCTELSLLDDREHLSSIGVIDSMDALAFAAIGAMGKQAVGFEFF